jgi:hypothetical protein
MNDMQEALAMLRQQVAARTTEEILRRLFTPENETEWRGFSGIMSLFDEPSFVPSWTPAQFEKMWDQFSHRAKVNFVRNLITPKG